MKIKVIQHIIKYIVIQYFLFRANKMCPSGLKLAKYNRGYDKKYKDFIFIFTHNDYPGHEIVFRFYKEIKDVLEFIKHDRNKETLIDFINRADRIFKEIEV